MRDPVTDADRPLDLVKHFLTPHPSTWKNYSCCPWAKSILVIDHETDRPVLCPVTCKRWGCPYCAVRKIRKLAFLVGQAAPNRWIRLGVRPQVYDSPKECWEITSPLVPEAFRLLRKHNPGIDYEYLRVAELHTGDAKYGHYGSEAKGYPHYHCLLRSPYIAQRQLSSIWAQLTAPKMPPVTQIVAQIPAYQARGLECSRLIKIAERPDADKEKWREAWSLDLGAPNVWIAKIDSTFSSFRYLVKYLTKLHRIEWTDRHVSYSKGFIPEEALEKLAFPERDIEERSEEHPWVWLSRRFPNTEVGVDDNGCYHLPEMPYGTPYTVARTDVGLPDEPGTEAEKTLDPQTAPLQKHVQRTMIDRSTPASYADASF